MNSSDELSILIADFELFLKEVSIDVLNKAKHRQILLRIHEFLINLQQSPKSEDQITKLAKVISESLVSKIEAIDNNSKIETLTQEIQELKTINSQILTKLNDLNLPNSNNLEEVVVTEITKNYNHNNHERKSIKSLTELLVTATDTKAKRKDIWYLGLDFGTLGLAAVLFNANTHQQYPLYWYLKDVEGIVNEQFRFPTVIYQSTVNKSVVLGGLNLPSDDDLVIDNYKPYCNLSIFSGTKNLELLTKLLLEIHGAQTSDLEQVFFKKALGELQGVIVSFPSAWSDTYHFNLRESILETHLVETPSQIFYLEEAIAGLLGRWQEGKVSSGWTIIFNGGNYTTEIALVNLPQNWQTLSHDDFSLQTNNYAQRALEQDIFVQFIYPLYAKEIPTIKSELPQPGKVEKLKRNQLDEYLQSYPLAHSFIEAARLISLMLREQETVNVTLGNYKCNLKDKYFFETIIEPFLTELATNVQTMLAQKNITPEEIEQVICTGGFSLGIGKYLPKWFGQKFPQAKVMIDTESENALRVARGLAYLPLFPQLLDRSRHQYSDYFLLKELLKALPVELFTIEELMQKLVSRGINTRVCRQRILNLLKGEFPPGILKTALPRPKSLVLPQVQKGYYRVNIALRDYLQQSLSTILSQSLQQMSEPLLVNLPLTHESP